MASAKILGYEARLPSSRYKIERGLIEHTFCAIIYSFSGGTVGLVLSFVGLSASFYMGLSGTTGEDTTKYWNPKFALFLSSQFGLPFATLGYLTCYIFGVRRLPLLRIFAWNTVGAILGMVLGCFFGPVGLFFFMWFGYFVSIALYTTKQQGKIKGGRHVD